MAYTHIDVHFTGRTALHAEVRIVPETTHTVGAYIVQMRSEGEQGTSVTVFCSETSLNSLRDALNGVEK